MKQKKTKRNKVSNVRNKGQIALETVIIIGFVLALMVPLLHTLFMRVLSVQDELRMLEASRAVDTITNAVSTVGVIGPNGTATVEIILPNNVKNISIGKINDRTNSKEVVIVLSTGLGDIDLVRMTNYPVTGSIRTTSGSHKVKITYPDSGLPIIVNE